METGKDAVALHSRLQAEKARKITTHRILGNRNMEPTVRRAVPSRAKQATARKRKFKPNVTSAPTCASAPKIRTEKTVRMTRKDKKNPIANAKVELGGVRRFSSSIMSLAGLIV